MCGRREISEWRGEAGMLLMELAVSLPVFVLLLSFLAFAVAWSWRSYQREIADAELRQEMQIAAARIVESALLSDHIREYMTGVYEMRQRVRSRLLIAIGCGTVGLCSTTRRFPSQGHLRGRACLSPLSRLPPICGIRVSITSP